jgi:hypothetical protein
MGRKLMNKESKMIRLTLILSIMLLTLTNTAFAGSLQNLDSDPYTCRIKQRMGVDEEIVYPESTVYFDCTYGCEITLLKTGQTLKIESDKEIVIDDGEMKIAGE